MSSAISATTSTSSAYVDDTSSRVTSQTLDQSDFLELLTVQMTNQDPMNPISDTDQIAQLAQFSSLQAMNTVASEVGYLRADSQLASASSLIGCNVTVTSDDTTVTGTVDSVQADSSSVYVTINGTQYAYGLITAVSPATTTTE